MGNNSEYGQLAILGKDSKANYFDAYYFTPGMSIFGDILEKRGPRKPYPRGKWNEPCHFL